MPAGWEHIAGFKIAHAQDDRARTGCKVFVAEAGMVAAAVNLPLTRDEAGRLAEQAAPGMARVLSPAHTQLDGDILFVLAPAPAGSRPRAELDELGRAAAECVARAIVRGVASVR